MVNSCASPAPGFSSSGGHVPFSTWWRADDTCPDLPSPKRPWFCADRVPAEDRRPIHRPEAPRGSASATGRWLGAEPPETQPAARIGSVGCHPPLRAADGEESSARSHTAKMV